MVTDIASAHLEKSFLFQHTSSAASLEQAPNPSNTVCSGTQVNTCEETLT